jgi:hypothetical protein
MVWANRHGSKLHLYRQSPAAVSGQGNPPAHGITRACWPGMQPRGIVSFWPNADLSGPRSLRGLDAGIKSLNQNAAKNRKCTNHQSGNTRCRPLDQNARRGNLQSQTPSRFAGFPTDFLPSLASATLHMWADLCCAKLARHAALGTKYGWSRGLQIVNLITIQASVLIAVGFPFKEPPADRIVAVPDSSS